MLNKRIQSYDYLTDISHTISTENQIPIVCVEEIIDSLNSSSRGAILYNVTKP